MSIQQLGSTGSGSTNPLLFSDPAGSTGKGEGFAAVLGFSVAAQSASGSPAQATIPGEASGQNAESWGDSLLLLGEFADAVDLSASSEAGSLLLEADVDVPELEPADEQQALLGQVPLHTLLLPEVQPPDPFTEAGMSSSGLRQGLQNLTGLLHDDPGAATAFDADGNPLPQHGNELPHDFMAGSTGRGTAPGLETTDLSTGTSTELFGTALQNSLGSGSGADSDQASLAALSLAQQGIQAAAARDARTAVPLDARLDAGLLQMQSEMTAGSEAWVQDLGTRVEWLQNAGVNRAELFLHPAELGALEIRISSEDDVTRVTFMTQTAGARELIEQNMPRLRELLASQGLHLQEGSVSQQQAGEGRQHGSEAGSRHSSTPRDAGEQQDQTRLRSRVATPGRIDHYV